MSNWITDCSHHVVSVFGGGGVREGSDALLGGSNRSSSSSAVSTLTSPALGMVLSVEERPRLLTLRPISRTVGTVFVEVAEQPALAAFQWLRRVEPLRAVLSRRGFRRLAHAAPFLKWRFPFSFSQGFRGLFRARGGCLPSGFLLGR